jgi:hypothetical protein
MTSDTPRTNTLWDRFGKPLGKAGEAFAAECDSLEQDLNSARESLRELAERDRRIERLEKALGDRAAPDGYCVVPVSTVNDLLSVKPDKCPAKVLEALYELASLASRPAGVPDDMKGET